ETTMKTATMKSSMLPSAALLRSSRPRRSGQAQEGSRPRAARALCDGGISPAKAYRWPRATDGSAQVKRISSFVSPPEDARPVAPPARIVLLVPTSNVGSARARASGLLGEIVPVVTEIFHT